MTGVKSQVLVIAVLMLMPLTAASAQEADDPFSDDFFLDDPFSIEADEDSMFEIPAVDDSADNDSMFDDPFAGSEDASEEEIISFDDFDSMFDTDTMVEEIDEDEASADVSAADEFLLNEGVEFGGSFSGSFSAGYDYQNLYTEDFDFTDPAKRLTPSVSADLFFDARPEADYRVFGKLGFVSASGNGQDLAAIIPEGGLTFATGTDEDGNTTFTAVDEEDVDPDDPNQTTITQEDADAAQGDTSTELNLSVKELFADFDWNDKLFFRFGKSTIKWGVGYFWSPADVLNLTAIDVEDPTAEREGPVSFKMHLPYDINNAYLYLIAENVEEPLDVAVAPKVELVTGNTEIGLGAYYQRDIAPRAVTTLSTTLGDFAVFGEGVLIFGSDKVFVRPSKDQSAAEEDEEDDLELVLDTYEVDDRLFFSATVGTNYMHEFEDNAGTFLFIGQYFFNGEGYTNDVPGLLEAAYRLSLNSGENGLALPAAEQPEGYEDPPALGTGDLTNFGRHYLGAMVSWSSIFDSDFSFSTLAIANMTDFSGMVMPTLSYKVMDYISVGAGMRLTFGEVGDEYTNPAALLGFGGGDGYEGPTMSLTLDVSIGGGSF